MTWWKADMHLATIREVTDKYKNQQETGIWWNVFPSMAFFKTRGEAYAWKHGQLSGQVEKAKRDLAAAEKRLKNFEKKFAIQTKPNEQTPTLAGSK